MPTPPIPTSVLLLDDGELDSVDGLLRRLGADLMRLTGSQISGRIQQPRDLLVTSGKRVFNMPKLEVVEGAGHPTWLCVHNQDFLPLRERLRGEGVNFLAHSALELEALRMFLLQMLYTGSERRASRRLPLGVEVTLSIDGHAKIVRLLEVSSESCSILTPEPLPAGSRISLTLPQGISGDGLGELRGTPVRTSACQTRTGEIAYSTVLRFDDLGVGGRAMLDRITRGEQIGTRLSPLAKARSGPDVSPPSPAPSDASVKSQAPIASAPEPSEASELAQDQNQRSAERHTYNRRVQLLDLCDSDADTTALGCDLSLDGICVDGYRELESGSVVSLALYAGRREEPLVVTASVIRKTGSDQVAFRFEELNTQQKWGLEKLMGGRDLLESLDIGRPIVMTKLVDRA